MNMRILFISLLAVSCNQYGTIDKLEQAAKGTLGYSMFMPDALSSGSFLNQVASWFGDAACGDLLGVAKGNCGCTYTARKLGIANGKEFKIWISDSATDAICNIQGLQNNTCSLNPNAGPFLSAPECTGLEEGCDARSARLVSKNLSDLLSIDLISQIAPLNLSNATYYQTGAWTGTGINGRSSGLNCLNWSTVNGVESGTVGNPIQKFQGIWTNSGLGSCNNSTGFLCVEKIESE